MITALLTGCAPETETQPPADPPAADSADTETDGGDSAAPEGAPAEPDIAVVEEMEVTLYLPNDTADAFDERTETVDAEPQGIVDALIAHGALPEDVVVNSFQMRDNGVETTDGETVSYTAGDQLHIDLDLSSEFQTALAGTGTSGETMMLGSLVNTMLAAYHADTITVTCDGEPLETGHNVYDQPLEFYDL